MEAEAIQAYLESAKTKELLAAVGFVSSDNPLC